MEDVFENDPKSQKPQVQEEVSAPPKKQRKTRRPMSDETKARLRAQLARGRETSKKNREKKKKAQEASMKAKPAPKPIEKPVVPVAPEVVEPAPVVDIKPESPPKQTVKPLPVSDPIDIPEPTKKQVYSPKKVLEKPVEKKPAYIPPIVKPVLQFNSKFKSLRRKW